jgi:hypothetical protein
MPGDLNYAADKYSLAVEIMATSHGSLQARLYNGYMNQATRTYPIRNGPGPQMSTELAERIEGFHQRMTAKPAGADHQALEATIMSFTDDEAEAAASELVWIANQIIWELRRAYRD